ncbi:hypothetical protein SETIT_8G127900v2 [Setaria italica]|uniref:Uncharacterized protein n=2 Tax=Setaria TaxID=4554 RepID=A0A368S746_SETIT|nr:hypothetical protein SETIT_8G127900v2 [Setaria italica]TKW00781.1 hypothetical protein SEVIR_8G134700v2 [Setaria viridis]
MTRGELNRQLKVRLGKLHGHQKWRPWMLVGKLRSLKRERKWLSFNRFMTALIFAWGFIFTSWILRIRSMS